MSDMVRIGSHITSPPALATAQTHNSFGSDDLRSTGSRESRSLPINKKETILSARVSDELHLAWTEFLSSQRWQWFVTFTFKDEIHPEAADKLYRVWINKLNLSIYGRKWRKRPPFGVKHVRALEWQKRGVLHYHSLMAHVGFEDRNRWAHVWSELGKDSKAGFIKIDQYDESKGGAESYLSKYVTKGGQIDISLNFNANPWTEQDPTNATTKRQKAVKQG